MPLKLIDAVMSADGFRSYFKGLESWSSWCVLFKVLSGEALTAAELEVFKHHTGRAAAPTFRIRELYVCAGRRSGKSTVAGLLCAFYSIWGGWSEHLAAGERARIFLVSPTLAQGQVVRGYTLGMIRSNKKLWRFVKREARDSLEISDVTVEIKAASWRSTKGFTVGLLILEELSAWRFEDIAANQDTEIYTSLVPSMLTIPNSLVVGISTPFARDGLLWRKFNANWGKVDSSILSWRGCSWEMNKTLNEKALRDQYFEELGPAAFGAEFEAKFREDMETFLPLEIVNAAIVKGRSILAPDPALTYFGFADPSEGLRKGGDSFAFSVGHNAQAGGHIIIDGVYEWPAPFSPKIVLEQLAGLCANYGLAEIVQDRYAVAWIAADLEAFGVQVRVAEESKSALYEKFALLMNKGEVELPDIPRLRSQLLGLMRTLSGGATVSVDHVRGGHDDCANVAAGCAVGLLGKRQTARKGTVYYVGMRSRPAGKRLSEDFKGKPRTVSDEEARAFTVGAPGKVGLALQKPSAGVPVGQVPAAAPKPMPGSVGRVFVSRGKSKQETSTWIREMLAGRAYSPDDGPPDKTPKK